ncbi:MFS transporter [Microbispora sp. RL4-1S]|uniref:MFS transporter n=1 Tax=Microbispora oryzae TaxID=2806554 RepID=A0A940WCL2_9ACTN|nr:MFS transporter [Microbispora oryzae]MBP2702976.1 MFS transporter [Microbispora oryzae]
MTQPARDEAWSPSGAEQAAPAGVITTRMWVTLVLVSLGAMMEALDSTVMAIGNPEIAVDLGTRLTQLQWVSNGYMFAVVVFLITAGKIGDRFGHRTTFLVGMVGFAAASVAAGLAGSIEVLIAARVVQGLFGAVLAPNSLAIIRNVVPFDRMKTAIGVWAGFGALAMAAGPFVGGLVVGQFGWRGIFFLNVPICVIVVIAGLLSIDRGREQRLAAPIDIPGVVVLSAALLALVWGIVRLPVEGLDLVTGLLFLAFVLLGALFLWRQQSSANAVLPLRLFHSTSLSAAVVVITMAAFVAFGSYFYFGLYLERVQGHSPLLAGVLLLPQTVLFGLGAAVGGKLAGDKGPRVPMMLGAVLVALGSVGITLLQADSSYLLLGPSLGLMGTGIGAIVPVAVGVILGHSPANLAGTASGMQQTGLMLGAVLGTAIIGTIISARVAGDLPGRLTAAGVPQDVASRAADQASVAAQGVLPQIDGAAPAVAAQIRTAVGQSFTGGLNTALIVGAALMVVAAVIASRVQAPPQESAASWG